MAIDYSKMKVGDTRAMPHKGAWEGANQAEYQRAQAYATASKRDPKPQFEVTQNMQADDASKPIPPNEPGAGYTIKRIR